MTVDFETFTALDMRVGRIINVEDFPRARNPSYKLTIDFGEDIGIKHSSAQITFYSKEALLNTNIIAVVNFAPRNIAGFLSEVLVLGAEGDDALIRVLTIAANVPIGAKIS